jgi:hypothetical protein
VTIRAAFPLRRRVKEGCKSRHPRPAKKGKIFCRELGGCWELESFLYFASSADFCKPSSPLIAQTTHLGINAELYLSQVLEGRSQRPHRLISPTWMPLRPRIIAWQRVISTRLLKCSPIDTIIRWVRGAGNSPVSGPNPETVDNHLSLDSITYDGHLIVR